MKPKPLAYELERGEGGGEGHEQASRNCCCRCCLVGSSEEWQACYCLLLPATATSGG